MGVRVCYLRRRDHGAALHALRLVGATSDEAWPATGAGDPSERGAGDSGGPGPAAYGAAAAWLRERLGATRSGGGLAMLCLDVEGGVCSWLTSPSPNPAVVAALARLGPAGSDGSADGRGPIEFYAGSALDSSVQALVEPEAAPARAAAGATPVGRRLPILATTDLPARLLVDALDREGVPVESVVSLWHAIAAAWDPGAPRPGSPSVEPEEDAPVTAVLVADPAGRLVWAWSRAGRLLVAGSVRLRMSREAESGESRPILGSDEVARLTAEWLAWAAQVGRAPRRIVAVLTEPAPDGEGRATDPEVQSDGTGPAAFGRALGEAWPGATVDVAVRPDPVGATLERMAMVLDEAPPSRASPSPLASLVDLSLRPGREHRRLYRWTAVAVAALAGVVAVWGWRLREEAAAADAEVARTRASWQEAVREIYPEALTPRIGTNALTILTEELTRREAALRPPERTDRTMPILQELETLSIVVGNAGLELVSIDLSSAGTTAPVKLVVTTPSTTAAEQLLEALRGIGGSHLTGWTQQIRATRDGDPLRRTATYTATWDPALRPARPGA